MAIENALATEAFRIHPTSLAHELEQGTAIRAGIDTRALSHRERAIAHAGALYGISDEELRCRVEACADNAAVVASLCSSPLGTLLQKRYENTCLDVTARGMHIWHRDAQAKLAAELERTRFWLNGGVVLSVTRDLGAQLMLTDPPSVDDSAGWPLPYPSIYIGIVDRQFELTTLHDPNGPYFAGVYVRAADAHTSLATVTAVICEEAQGTHSLTPLSPMTVRTSDIHAGSRYFVGRQDLSFSELVASKETDLALHALKLLHYCSCAQARLARDDANSRALNNVSGKGRKATKRRRAAARLVDQIVIAPPAKWADAADVRNHKAVKACHWRRGHFRRQPCGSGRADTRIRWIAPVIVKRGSDREPSRKTYLVR